MKFEKIYNSLLIVDGSYLIHRVLHNNHLFELRGPDGQRTGGVFGFIRCLNKELKLNPDYFPILCFDGGLDPRRTNADPNYKNAQERSKQVDVVTQEDADSDYLTQYRRQRAMTMELLSYAGIPSLRFNTDIREGDDIIYYLSKICNKGLVLTDDRDMLQLVSDNISVRRPMADELITKDILLQDYETIYDFIVNKAIIGDGSDSIPGCCKGVSGGTSSQLIKLLKLVDGSDINIDNEDKIREICELNNIKFRKAMLNFDKERFEINMELVDLNRVVVTENIQKSIISTIDNCRSSVNFFSFSKKLEYLGIKEVDPSLIISTVNERFKYLRS